MMGGVEQERRQGIEALVDDWDERERSRSVACSTS